MEGKTYYFLFVLNIMKIELQYQSLRKKKNITNIYRCIYKLYRCIYTCFKIFLARLQNETVLFFLSGM